MNAKGQERIMCGDAVVELARLAAGSVHLCVTSPPYLGLRNYGITPSVWPPVPAGHWADGWGEAADVSDCEHVWGGSLPRAGCEFRQGEGSGSCFAGRADKAEINEGQKRLKTRGDYSLDASAKQVTNTGSLSAPTEKVPADSGQFCQRCGAWRGVLGLEPDPVLFVWHLVYVFRAVRRVLRDDGLLFVNIGDSHCGTGYGKGTGHFDQRDDPGAMKAKLGVPVGMKPGDAMCTDWMLGMALRADGWYLRRPIIWHKPGPMPESVNGERWQRCRVKVGNTGREQAAHGQGIAQAGFQNHSGNEISPDAKWVDCPGCSKCRATGGFVLRRGRWRPTKAHEYVLMFSKSEHYFADRDAVSVAAKYDGRKDTMMKGSAKYAARNAWPDGNPNTCAIEGQERWPNRLDDGTRAANPRDVMTFKRRGFKGRHYATFPESLPDWCIRAGTSEAGVCPACGANWARVVAINHVFTAPPRKSIDGGSFLESGAFEKTGGWHEMPDARLANITLGWRPTCGCFPALLGREPMRLAEIAALDEGVRPVPATVLDCFLGAGTTLVAAKLLGRSGIGIELKAEYVEIARARLARLRPEHFAEPTEPDGDDGGVNGQGQLFGKEEA